MGLGIPELFQKNYKDLMTPDFNENLAIFTQMAFLFVPEPEEVYSPTMLRILRRSTSHQIRKMEMLIQH